MTLLITGGSGSLGNALVKRLAEDMRYNKIIIYSRCEFKQYEMKQRYSSSKLRYFIGDVRDYGRLCQALKGVDHVIHAAALKQVDTVEYNPIEAVKTNVTGAENVINACIEAGVKKAVFLSTDKGVNPINLYGCTKGVSDALAINANCYGGTRFSVVRYGNVAASRGSVIPFYAKLKAEGAKSLPVTHEEMTRFWITLDQAIDMILTALDYSAGGETYITKIPSFKVTDLVAAFGLPYNIIGIRPGEKLHECMVTEDMDNVYEYPTRYIVYPKNPHIATHILEGGKRLTRYRYDSGTNPDYLNVLEIAERLGKL